MLNKILEKVIDAVTSFLGATIFYTIIPLPQHWPLRVERIARWSPMIGLLLGGILGLADQLLSVIGFSLSVRSGLIIATWITMTGGLHLDGAMDTGDGLAVREPAKRLRVMQDSVTGAFGVMSGVMIIALKILALSELSAYRWWGLMVAAGWGRWGQVCAIAFYPYLKATGKGAFHQQHMQLPQDLLWGLLSLWGMSGVLIYLAPHLWRLGLGIALMGGAIALGISYGFYRRLGGHTGDTYGAVVEWTETSILCLLTLCL